MLRIFLLVSLILSSALSAAVPPPGYLNLTAEGKRDFHLNAAKATRYETLPSQPSPSCQQAMAFLTNFSPVKLRKTLTSPSGYASPDDTLRHDFGKGIHNSGPGTWGDLILEEPIMGLSAGTHPVTIRYSHANLHLPFGVLGARWRPGLVIIIHRGSGLDDMALFIMPPDGLDGYRKARSLYDIPAYTHWLNPPGLVVSLMEKVTFGRVVEDSTTLYVTYEELRNYSPDEVQPTRETTKQILFYPHKQWLPRYAQTTGSDFRERLAQLEVNANDVFLSLVVRDQSGPRILGEIRQLAGWINAESIDDWFVQHKGFRLRAEDDTGVRWPWRWPFSRQPVPRPF